MLSTPTAFAFNSQVTLQHLSVSVLETEASITINAPAGAAATVAGAPTSLGVASAPVAFAFGVSETVVSLTVGDLSRDYVLEVERGTVVPAEYARPVASNGDPSDNFGETIAVDDERILVGAFGESSNGAMSDNTMTLAGAAYVYRRNGSNWIQEQYLKGSPIVADRLFGLAVAIDGDVLVVGAHGLNIAGAVYVFRRTGTQWGEEVRLTAPAAAATDAFGFSVAVSGSLLAVGDIVCRCVYIYRLSGTAWSHDATVTSTDTVAGDQFALRVALQDDLLLVAAPGENSAATGVLATPATDSGATGNGAVYAFREISNGIWNLEAFVKPLTPIVNGSFGWALALQDDSFVVGGTGRDDVHAVARAAGTWSQPIRIQPSVATQGFGQAVALRRDLLAVGEASANAVHLFRVAGTTWLPAGTVSRTSGMSGDRYGFSVALLGHSLVVGAPSTESSKGAAHVVR